MNYQSDKRSKRLSLRLRVAFREPSKIKIATAPSEGGHNLSTMQRSCALLALLLLISHGSASFDPRDSNFQSFQVDVSTAWDLEAPSRDEYEVSTVAMMIDEDNNNSYTLDFSSDDDDDDDENDGSSSMLSTASLSKGMETMQKIRGGASPALGAEVVRRLLVVALVTLVYEGAIGHILEFLKIVMQTAPPGTTYGKVISDITAAKGIAGLWDGFCPWGIVQALFKGSVFGLAHTTASGFLVPWTEQGKLPMALALTLAGGIGGGFQGFVLSPTLLLKTRVMTNPVFREKMSALRTTWLSFLIGFEVVKKEGFLTLMKGANVFATKRVFDWSTRYFFSDLIESILFRAKGGLPLTVLEKSSASLLGGVFSTMCTLPLDVLVAKTQDATKAGVKVSAFRLFQEELKEKGWSGLRKSYMKGFEARLAHVCTTTLVIKTGTPIVYDMIFGPKA